MATSACWQLGVFPSPSILRPQSKFHLESLDYHTLCPGRKISSPLQHASKSGDGPTAREKQYHQGLEKQGMDLMRDGKQRLMRASWTTMVKVLSRDWENPTEWPPALLLCNSQEQIARDVSPDPPTVPHGKWKALYLPQPGFSLFVSVRTE